MVRVFDPERNSGTLVLIDMVQQYFRTKQYGISTELIRPAIQHFIEQDGWYSKQKEKFRKDGYNFPKLRMKSNCKSNNKVQILIDRSKDIFIDRDNFKGYYESQNNQIVVCSNLVSNFVELKENIDRELVVAYDYQKYKDYSEEKKDQEQGCSMIRCCKKGMESYRYDGELDYEMSKLCAKILHRERGTNWQGLAYDVWVRYSSQLIDRNMDRCYQSDI